MSDLIFLIFIYFVEALTVFLYFHSIYIPKKKALTSFIITVFSYMILFVIINFIYNNEIFNTFLIIIVNIIIALFLYESSFKSSIFHGFALGILQLLTEFISLYTIAACLNVEAKSAINNNFEIATIISKILYFFVSRLLVIVSVKENRSHTWGKWFGLALLPLSSIIIVIVLRVTTNDVVLKSYENIFLISSISFLLLVNIIIYIIYEQAEKSNQKLIELELINQKSETDMQYLELLEKKNEAMNIMAHDYKNHILTIANMSDSPEIKNYIDNMIGEISKYNHISKTKNKILDVIINKYTDICNSKGITFKTSVMTDNLSFINDYDISSLFNNILDNAVEAAEHSFDKHIELEITSSQNTYHKIIVINSCDNEPISQHGNLITSKKNKAAHGFGTKSIKKVINKYNGELQWEYSNELRQFKLIIIFPFEQ